MLALVVQGISTKDATDSADSCMGRVATGPPIRALTSIFGMLLRRTDHGLRDRMDRPPLHQLWIGSPVSEPSIHSNSAGLGREPGDCWRALSADVFSDQPDPALRQQLSRNMQPRVARVGMYHVPQLDDCLARWTVHMFV